MKLEFTFSCMVNASPPPPLQETFVLRLSYFHYVEVFFFAMRLLADVSFQGDFIRNTDTIVFAPCGSGLSTFRWELVAEKVFRL